MAVTFNVFVLLLVLTMRITPSFARQIAPCHEILSLNLENGTKLENGSILFDGLTFPPSSQYSLDGQLFGCPCMVKQCIRRCCKPGLFEDRGCHEPWAESYGINVPPIPEGFLHPSISNLDNHFYVIYERNCIVDNAFILWITGPKKSSNEHFNVTIDGLLSHYNERDNQSTVFLYGQEQYCLAWSEVHNVTKIRACINPEEYQTIVIDNMLRWSMGISNWLSAFFCLLTFLIYSLFEDLRNIHGNTLMCYVMCLAVADILVPFIRNNELQNVLFDDTGCQAIAYIVHFSFLASFFWLNVMCFDIWWTFGGFRSLHGSVKQRERKKFIMYSIYAWGCASILTGVCMIMDLVPGIPDDIIRPEFGVASCWFNTNIARAIYFYGPMGVTVLCNICLFIITAVKISRHQQDTARQLKGSDSKRHDDNKQWFNLYLKLFVVMGINWSMEIISWLYADNLLKYLWYVTDLTNTLQGVIIFLIFVWKAKIKRLLLQRFGCMSGKYVTRNSTTRTGCPSNSSVASRATCITVGAPLQEKPSNFAPDTTGCRGKINTVCTESDCI